MDFEGLKYWIDDHKKVLICVLIAAVCYGTYHWSAHCKAVLDEGDYREEIQQGVNVALNQKIKGLFTTYSSDSPMGGIITVKAKWYDALKVNLDHPLIRISTPKAVKFDGECRIIYPEPKRKDTRVMWSNSNVTVRDRNGKAIWTGKSDDGIPIFVNGTYDSNSEIITVSMVGATIGDFRIEKNGQDEWEITN